MKPFVHKRSWAKWLSFKPHHPYVIAFVGFILASVLFTYIIQVNIETYKALRGSLFTGFFTVAGFLLSAKTLVILNMKKEIYEKDPYLTKIHTNDWSNTPQAKKLSKLSRSECGGSEVYRPLSQIGTLLSINIILALITSFSQITFGLVECGTCIILCLSLALATALLLACSVLLMWLNFQALYWDWERLAQIELEKKWNSSIEEFHTRIIEPEAGPLPEIPSVPPGEKLGGEVG
jgi:hypothetical protein